MNSGMVNKSVTERIFMAIIALVGVIVMSPFMGISMIIDSLKSKDQSKFEIQPTVTGAWSASSGPPGEIRYSSPEVKHSRGRTVIAS